MGEVTRFPRPTRRCTVRRIATFVLLLGLAACVVPARGVHHVVRRGENLFRIGKAYGVDYRELARVNAITDPARIEIGQQIFVPGATRRLPVEIITPTSVETASSPPFPPLPAGTYRLLWPTRGGSLSSRFGPRNGSFHDGIDIAASEGTPVHAARAGRIIYSDEIPGYGNIVIVDHGHGLSTVYAHNAENLVKDGDRVEAGQPVARIGRTGRTTGANLHFEVRERNVARDPLAYLPPPGPTARR